MTLSISDLHGHRYADIESVSVNGLPGCGNNILYIRLSAVVERLDANLELSHLTCLIEIGDTNLRCASGVLEGHPVITWYEHSSNEYIGFMFYLTDAQINSIESIRNSGDLKLSVWLSGTLFHKENHSTFMNKGSYVVPKQQWIEALGLMRYKSTLLFELAMPNEKADKQLRQLLEQAYNHILNGHYRDSVSLCRQAIEFVEKDRGDKKQASEAVSKYKDSRHDMSTLERMLFLREGLKNITHLGSHLGDDFSRQQAQAVLGMTVAMLSSPEIGL